MVAVGWLERQLETILDLTRTFRLGCHPKGGVNRCRADNAGIRRARQSIRVEGGIDVRSSRRIARELHVIEQVEEVHPELDVDSLSSLEVFVHTHVGVGDRRAVAIANGGSSRQRSHYIAVERVAVGIDPVLLWSTGRAAGLPWNQQRTQAVLTGSAARKASGSLTWVGRYVEGPRCECRHRRPAGVADDSS